MSLITGYGLRSLCDNGMVRKIPSDKQINSASVDITLGRGFEIEQPIPYGGVTVNLADKEDGVNFQHVDSDTLILHPGQFCLATSAETFDLPDGVFIHPELRMSIAAEYKENSSMARNGLNHLLAGWCDPGWHGGHLTLELHNVLQYHRLKLTAGMRIGQMVFWSGDPIPPELSYARKGNYNKQNGVTRSKGVGVNPPRGE